MHYSRPAIAEYCAQGCNNDGQVLLERLVDDLLLLDGVHLRRA
jgi:hypothetical protein